MTHQRLTQNWSARATIDMPGQVSEGGIECSKRRSPAFFAMTAYLSQALDALGCVQKHHNKPHGPIMKTFAP
eukprot:750346-Hanusia_phi.AAC.6